MNKLRKFGAMTMAFPYFYLHLDAVVALALLELVRRFMR
jgi:hypothetical protein